MHALRVVYISDSASSPYVNMDLGPSDSLPRGLGKETEFDRRKKKEVSVALHDIPSQQYCCQPLKERVITLGTSCWRRR